MWCTECKTYVSLVTFNTGTGDCKKDDGQCPPYTYALAETYRASMESVFKGGSPVSSPIRRRAADSAPSQAQAPPPERQRLADEVPSRS